MNSRKGNPTTPHEAAPEQCGARCETPSTCGSPRCRWRMWLVFLTVAAIGLAGDLLSKHYAFSTLLSDPEAGAQVVWIRFRADQPLLPEQILHSMDLHRQFIPGVQLTLSTNPGAVFGSAIPRWLVAAVTVSVIIVLPLIMWRTNPRKRLLPWALGLVLAGACGNFYDRLFSAVQLPADGGVIHRQVRDFIDCSQIYYPYVFNVADVLLVIGVGMLFMQMLFAGGSKRRQA